MYDVEAGEHDSAIVEREGRGFVAMCEYCGQEATDSTKLDAVNELATTRCPASE